MKKYAAEFIGTAVLVLMGCGTAMLLGCDPFAGNGYMLTAFAFGLAIVAMAYCIGPISGCHVNPAVSLAVLLSGRMEKKDFAGYVIAQILGAFAGAAILHMIFRLGDVPDMTGGFGANGIAALNYSIFAGLIVETVLTFIFVITILGVTSETDGNGSLAGLVIGLTLTFVHIFGIGLTGTSVNPARSIAPAVFALINGNPEPLVYLWIFIVGPLLGSFLATLVYKLIRK
ncbi:MAG: MIP family channel protein [Lachnospiraceae bacterium]|nr:MIP family channel protein [Lachnospiraceae bacterium]